MKIMIISDSPLRQTGYGRQVRDLYKMFTRKGHRVVFVGMHSHVQRNEIQEYKDSKVYAMMGPNDPSPLGRWEGPDKEWLQYATLIEEPDIVLLVWDLRKVLGIVRDFDRFFRCPVYLYWLFDSEPISHQYVDLMKKTSINILPVSQCICRWMDKLGIEYFREPIPEPVDPLKFYPLQDDVRERLKHYYLGSQADKVCFGFVGGNFQRKNIPFLIDAFAALPGPIMEDSVLFLHTDPDAHEKNIHSFDLREIIKTYHPDLIDKVIFSKSNNDINFEMRDVYNVMDWFVSGAHGEGWGLPTVESMACGIPVIIGDISTSEEIIGEVGFRVPISGYIYTPSPYLRVTVPDFDTFVVAMINAHTMFRSPGAKMNFPDWDNRSKNPKTVGDYEFQKAASIERARLFRIDIVASKWNQFFENINNADYDYPYHYPGWTQKLLNETVTITDKEEKITVEDKVNVKEG